MNENSRGFSKYLTTAYFLSGLVALSFEILWFRSLELSLGTSAPAMTSLLSGYMLGLSLGAMATGLLLKKRNYPPLKALAALHLLMALFGAALLVRNPLLYLPSWLPFRLHWILGMFLVIPTAAAAGGTFPALAHLIPPSNSRGALLARYYGLNIIGGAIGIALTSFAGLYFLGHFRSTISALVLSLLLSLAFLYMPPFTGGREVLLPAPHSNEDEPSPRWLAVAFILGFSGMGLEMATFRLLTPVMGLSIYALACTVIPYLLGLGFGGVLAGKLARRDVPGYAPILSAFAGLAMGLFYLTLRYLPGTMVWLAKSIPPEGISWSDFLSSRIILSIIVLLPATVLIGTLFPLVLSLACPLKGPGTEATGFLAGSNTLGAVLGPVIVNMILIGSIGSSKTFRAMALAYPILSISFLNSTRFPRKSAIAVSLLAAALIVFTPAPDPLSHYSGAYWAARQYEKKISRPDQSISSLFGGNKRVNALIEGPTASVLVVQEGDQRYLSIDGKPASNTILDSPTQIALARLPLELNSDIKKVLVIGWGSGQTVAEVLKYPVEEVVSVEISEEVLMAALWFQEVNETALSDPRLTLVNDDARHYLQTTSEKFDLIISQPSNPWVGFSGNLFTLEFFRMCREKLTSSGIMVQWFQSYGADRKDIYILMKTFTGAFDNWSLWSPQPGDLLLMTHKAGNTPPAAPKHNLWLDRDDVRLEGIPVNLDDRPILSYRMARKVIGNQEVIGKEQLIEFGLR